MRTRCDKKLSQSMFSEQGKLMKGLQQYEECLYKITGQISVIMVSFVVF